MSSQNNPKHPGDPLAESAEPPHQSMPVYSYANVEALSYAWGVDLDEAKARFGRQLLWRDGRAELAKDYSEAIDAGLQGYRDSQYTYDDAARLASVWESRVEDAKVLIGKRQLQGKSDWTDGELKQAPPSASRQ
jgi:hypothetical protein